MEIEIILFLQFMFWTLLITLVLHAAIKRKFKKKEYFVKDIDEAHYLPRD